MAEEEVEEEEVEYSEAIKKKPPKEDYERETEQLSTREATEERAKVSETPVSRDLPTLPGPRATGVIDLLDISPRDFLEVTEVGPGAGVPFIGHASWDTDELAWYDISFPEQEEPPSVVPVSEHRGGYYEPEDLYSPHRVDKKKIANKAEDDSENALERALGDWSVGFSILGHHIGISLNWIRDAIIWAIGEVVYIVAYLITHIIQMVYESIAAHATSAVFKGIDKLHQFSERPQMKVTTPEVRNVTKTGAEIMGYEGGRNHVVVIGERAIP